MDMVGAFLFILGAVVGSFLNVCIVRMPREESVVKPRSHCAHCKTTIPWYDNVPLFSYLFLRGRCRFCGKKIARRYFLVELMTALTFVGFYQYFGLTILLLPYLVMVSGFIVATFVDFEHRIIPDEISVGGMFIALFLSCWIPQLHSTHFDTLTLGRLLMRGILGLGFLLWMYNIISTKARPDSEQILSALICSLLWAADWSIEIFSPGLQTAAWSRRIAPHILSLDAAVVGGMVGGGSIYMMGVLGDFLFKKESMGGGDVKLMAMVGAFMGWQMALLAFFLAPFFGAVYGLVEKIRTNDTAIAYGPFLVLGSLICLFWGDAIIAWIMRGYGLY
jgi:leader peptidase (prepilin peptidase)/N-methyltransferase